MTATVLQVGFFYLTNMQNYSKDVIDKLKAQGLRSSDCIEILDICNKYVEEHSKVIKIEGVKGMMQLYYDMRKAQQSKDFQQARLIQGTLDKACKQVLR